MESDRVATAVFFTGIFVALALLGPIGWLIAAFIVAVAFVCALGFAAQSISTLLKKLI